MKNLTRVLLLVMITASLSSCESIKGIFDVEVDTTIEGEMDILTDGTALKSTNDYGFNESITVAVLNDDLYEYEDKIQGFKTSDVTIEVLSVDSVDVVFLPGTIFTISNGVNPSVSWEILTEWPVAQGSMLDLLDSGLYAGIETILDERVDITISAVGSANKGNVHATIRVGIEVTVVANPLD
jgi:hypothetical protein